jgi:abhydrolase domain-containing protein 17
MDLKVNILAVEYPGYGIYQGSPSEDAILKDANYIYQYLTKHSGVEERNIIIFGRSIGTGYLTETS